MFDKTTFEKAFAVSLDKIIGSEAITKKELREVSRTILEAWHATGQVAYANKLLKVLTPVNKKTMVLFFTHFSGFHFNDDLKEFDHKSKKRYDKAHADCMEFLANPNNNVWSYAERNIKIEHKPFDILGVEKYIKGALNKVAGVGLTQVDLLKAVFKAGIDPACIIQVMDELGFEFDAVEPDQQQKEIEPALF